MNGMLKPRCFFVLPFFFVLAFCHYEPGGDWRRIPQPIANSKNNFIRIELPKVLKDDDQQAEVEFYWVAVFKEEEGWMNRFVLINPRKDLSFWSMHSGAEQYKFSSGCELSIPISSGWAKYEIQIGKYPPINRKTEYYEADLLPNQSLRIKIDFVKFPKPIDQEYLHPLDRNSWHKPLRMEFSKEEGTSQSRLKPCDIDTVNKRSQLGRR